MNQPAAVPLPEDQNTGLPPGFGVPGRKPKQAMQPGPVPAPAQAPAPVRSLSKSSLNMLPDSVYELMASGGQVEEVQELYPEGLTQEMIDAWKTQFGANRVMLIVINDRVYVFRHILRPEYKSIKKMENADQDYIEEKIVSMCTLWPRMTDLEWRDESAGIANTLCASIMRASGFNATVQPFKL